MVRTQDEVERADLATLAKWCSTSKSFFTRQSNDVNTKVGNLSQVPTSAEFMKDMQKSMSSLRERYEEATFLYYFLEEKCDTKKTWDDNYASKLDEIQTKMTEREAQYVQATKEALAAQDAALQRVDARGGGAGGGGGAAPGGGAQVSPKYKLESSFKPKKDLTQEFTLFEFKLWKDEWEAYFQISNLSRATNEVQKMVLKSCVSSDFLATLDLSHQFTVADCLEIIATHFSKANPRMLLRHKYLKLRQEKGQSVSQLVTCEAQMARDAEVSLFTPEELRAHVLMAAISDKELLKKLLEVKEQDLTVDKIKQVSDIYLEQNRTVEGLNGSAGSKAFRVDAGDSGRGMCWKCHKSSEHRSTACPIPPSQLHCDHCAKAGLKAKRHNTNSFCFNQLKKRAESY